MANKINLTLKVNDDGSLDITAKKARKAAAETEKLGNATNKAAAARSKYNKGEKGVAQAGMNTTKSFSKMRDAMGGSSGLVGAYATLAANVFAATAAFGALQRAAEFDQLTQSVEFFGNAAGRNLELIVDQLVEVTDGALSAEQAFRGTALAISSGFDTEQLVRLTGVAKGASVALGRDLNDAFDRLVRGAAKLEPEILDELGIMVRLDDAVRDYATELGKVPGQLTSFEKRQAFLNATIKAGESQFKELQDSVPVNPFNQLAAAFSNLTKEGIGLLNTVLIPVANFFSSSQTALVGGTVLFASTISRQMLPALADSAGRLRDVATASRDNSVANLEMLDSVSKNDTVFNRYLKGLRDGTETIDGADKAIKSLDNTHGYHQRTLDGTNKRVKLNDESRKVATAGRAAAVTQLNLLTAAMNANSLATAQNTASSAASAFGALQFGTGFTLLKDSITGYSGELEENAKKSKNTKVSFKGLKVASFAVGTGLRAITSAAFGLLAPLGLLISFGPAILDFFKNKFFPEDEMQKKFDRLLELTAKVEDAEKQFTESSLEGSARRVAGQKAGLGAQGEIIRMLDQTLAAEQEQGRTIEASKTARKEELQQIVEDSEERIKLLQSLKGAELQRELQARGNASQATGRANRALRELQNIDDQIAAGSAKAAGNGPAFQEAMSNALATLKASPELSTFMSPAINEMEGLLESFKNGEITTEDLTAKFKVLANEADAGTQFINGIQGAVAGLATQQNALRSKAQGPYDAITNAAKGVVAELDKVDKGAASITDKLKADNLAKYKDQIDKIFGKDATEGDIRAFTTQLIKNNDTVKSFPGLLEESKQKLEVLNKVAELSPAAFAAANKELDEQRRLRKLALAAERDLIVASETTNNVLSEEGKILQANFNRRIAAVDAEAKLDTSITRRIKSSEISLNNEKQLLDVRKNLGKALDTELKVRKKIAETDLKLANLRDPKKQSSALDATDQLNLQQQFKADEEAANLRNFQLTVQSVHIETELTKLKFELIKEQLRAAGTLDDATEANINSAIATVGRLGDQQKVNAVLQFAATKKNIELETDERKKAFTKFASTQGSSLSGLFNLNQSTVTTEDGGTQSGTAQFFDTAAPREKLDFLKGLTSEYVETLKTLGPDGEFIASLAQGTFAITESFVTLGEQLDKDTKGMARFGAISQAVGASIGAVNQMMQAGYQKTIGKIDEQIAAEQKRDGKSAASVAKIQALEKKKEKTQRKAFETNKKMLMAQTIANTAAGIAGVLAGIKDPLVTAPLAVAMAAVIGAMGAAQLAVISGQSFDGGGGSSAGASVPSSISMGSRKSSVDLATSRSARGELAYFRGESGTGGPENFRGAFAGYRSRAEGGNTGFMVGEQGPELFMPDRPGTIVPNDDIAGGGSANVTFNISAIDAVGVEEVISNQRGNIIGMIRSAANSYGEDFIESVDPTVFDDNTVRSQAGSVSRY